ncbi:MAG TPA: sigma-70 family RNA polymerase sigma factor [Planctomycetaceae bacterium]|nr:sigma-70 family RNA polymerase sigma factor [Planctomycetaceae bacterium]
MDDGSGTPFNPDTEVLLARVGNGDASAMSLVLDRHRDRLRRMVGMRLDRRLLPRLDPSDVVQEALAEAAQKLPDYVRERPVPFYPWLRRLAWEHLVRLHERHVRAGRRSVVREVHSVPVLSGESAVQLAGLLARSAASPDHRLVAAELKSRVMSALAQLPERDREILVLRYLEQLSNAEIAAVLSITDGAVRTRHTRALDRLTRVIERLEREEGS